MGAFVALLRGINLGPNNRLPMTALVEIFTEAGCRDIRTYIQSGNVVFHAKEATARRVPLLVTKALNERLGFRIPVVTRTAAELRAVVKHNPFSRSGAEPAPLHVSFLAERPAPSKVALLDPKRSPPDEFVVRGSEVYLRLPNGTAKSKLTNAYFDAKLGTISTVRNWRTVLTLLEMAEAGG